MKQKIATFLPLQHISDIIDALSPHGESRLVGGCVRELILDKHPKDIDIATQAHPKDAIAALSKIGYNCIPTGIEHGTITAVKGHMHFEITTLRSDVSTDGRRAVVSFTKDWLEDAKRRDFTFNAMYMDLEGEVYDFFNGINDLQNKLVKFVGHPEDRIKEDYLRILRYFRFQAYVGGDNIDKPSLDACIALKDGVNTLSRERLHIELLKILSAPFTKHSLLLMCDTGVMDVFIPNVNRQHVEAIEFYDNVLPNFAALLKSASITESDFKTIAKHFALSNKQKSAIEVLLYKLEITKTFDHIAHKRIIYHHGYDIYSMYINMLQSLYPSSVVNLIEDWVIPKMPVSGSDLIKKGLAGKAIGVTMALITERWIASNFSLSKEKLMENI